MENKKLIKFSHPDNGGEIYLIGGQIIGLMILPAQRSVGVIGPGNAVVPVLGTVQEVVETLKKEGVIE
jgi:hypothetical protein